MTIINKLRKTIKDAEDRIKAVQSACPHPNETISERWDCADAWGEPTMALCICGLCEAEFRRPRAEIDKAPVKVGSPPFSIERKNE